MRPFADNRKFVLLCPFLSIGHPYQRHSCSITHLLIPSLFQETNHPQGKTGSAEPGAETDRDSEEYAVPGGPQMLWCHPAGTEGPVRPEETPGQDVVPQQRHDSIRGRRKDSELDCPQRVQSVCLRVLVQEATQQLGARPSLRARAAGHGGAGRDIVQGTGRL